MKRRNIEQIFLGNLLKAIEKPRKYGINQVLRLLKKLDYIR